MDVSDPVNQGAPKGQELIEAFADLSGLPEHVAHKEVGQILELTGHGSAQGKDAKDMTLEELRASVLAYLEMVDREMNPDRNDQEQDHDAGSPGSIPTLQS